MGRMGEGAILDAEQETRAHVVWEANKGPQDWLIASGVYEIFYGGARGGGKTEALLMDFAQDVGQGWGPAWKGVIFRKRYKQLEEIIDRSKKYFFRLFPGAKYNESDLLWRFPKGESLRFRHLDRDIHAEEYQGHEYPFLGFEELGNWATDGPFQKLTACCRSSMPGMPRKLRATGNPGGVGHQWVKARYIDPAPPLTIIRNEQGLSRVFIPANVYDNPAVIENDPDYVRRLESIKDDGLRRAWLWGDWDVVVGAFFAGIWDRDRHVIPTFYPPPGWILYRAFDWGSAHPFSVGFWAIADGLPVTHNGQTFNVPRGARVQWAEWYGAKKGEVNVGLHMSSKDIAEGIKQRVNDWNADIKARYGANAWRLNVYPGPAGSDIFETGKSDGGPSIASKMAAFKVPWVHADTRPGSRISGWDTMRQLLIGNAEGRPMLYIMDRCIDFLRTFPVLERDERIWDDINTDQEDHCADSARYACLFQGPRRPSGVKYWK